MRERQRPRPAPVAGLGTERRRLDRLGSRPDGSFPRAWEAGTGVVLESSKTASHLPVTFLARLAGATGKSVYLESALRAAEFCWNSGGNQAVLPAPPLTTPMWLTRRRRYSPSRLSWNCTGPPATAVWLNRAVTAASMAETWIYAWDLAMPVDADEADLDWKPGVSTIGMQLIATGVSTCDGFLAMNAAAFARSTRSPVTSTSSTWRAL